MITAKNLVIDSYRKETRRKTDSLGEEIQAASDGMWQSDPQRDLEVHMLGNIIDEIGNTKGENASNSSTRTVTP